MNRPPESRPEQPPRRSVQWRILRVGGTDLTIDPSWLLIFAFVAWTAATSLLPGRLLDEAFRLGVRPTASEGAIWLSAVLTSLLFFGSIVVHEVAHAYVAVRSGIPVQRIRLFIFGGIAEIAAEPTRPRQEFAITIVGPLASFVLAGAFLWLGSTLPEATLPRVTARWLGEMNLIVAVFNLLPGFPLDGGRLLRSAVWGLTGNLRRATRVATLAGSALGVALIVFGVAQFVLLPGAGAIGALWAVFIGWFMWTASRSSYRETLRREHLRNRSVRDILRRDFNAVPDNGTVAEFVDRGLYDDGLGVRAVVDSRGDPIGVVSAEDVWRVPHEERPNTPLRDAARPVTPAEILDASLSLSDALVHAERHGLRRFLVRDDGQLVGWIDLADASAAPSTAGTTSN